MPIHPDAEDHHGLHHLTRAMDALEGIEDELETAMTNLRALRADRTERGDDRAALEASSARAEEDRAALEASSARAEEDRKTTQSEMDELRTQLAVLRDSNRQLDDTYHRFVFKDQVSRRENSELKRQTAEALTLVAELRMKHEQGAEAICDACQRRTFSSKVVDTIYDGLRERWCKPCVQEAVLTVRGLVHDGPFTWTR